MKNYFSIGEVSKLKGVGIKSLRYYDEIGILKPAYVNPNTGYRYYTHDQLITLDIIFTCIDLGIPLKSFNRYRTETGTLMVDKILAEGRKLAAQKIAKINGNVAQMENLSQQIAAFQAIRQKQGDYRRSVGERMLLILPLTGENNDTLMHTQGTTNLYFRAKELGVVPLYQGGRLFYHAAEGVRQYVFLEVKGMVTADDLITMPPGKFLCRLYYGEEDEEIESRYIESPWPAGTVILECSIYGARMDAAPAPKEIQIYTPKNGYIPLKKATDCGFLSKKLI